MIIILLGAPGAGKGTQAGVLKEKLQVEHVSSGELLRDNIRRGTELGVTASAYMNRGELVPDNLVIAMILARMAAPDIERGIILDGFPRTLPQASALDDALSTEGKKVDTAFYIKVDNEVLLDRLSGRWTCPNEGRIYHEKFSPPKVAGICDLCGCALVQREDDKRETAVNRLRVYFEQTTPIIEYYRERELLCEVKGVQPIEKVTSDLLACLK